MVGIKAIGTYLPEGRISNYDRLEKFESDEDFIKNKIGILEVSLKSDDEDTSDLGVKAFENLASKIEIKSYTNFFISKERSNFTFPIVTKC